MIHQKISIADWNARIISIAISLFFVLIFLSNCNPQKKETTEELNARIQKKVEERLENRRKEKMKSCKKEALTLAEAQVDSILLLEAKLSTIDTFPKPIKPEKPSTPDLLIPKDSSEVKPLFEQTIDTIE